ncbi:MAG: 4-hydroxythreonine-4-phosphate dehydrogenase PdxA [Flavobacteriaceae bacterium]|nr:4-hydroxythreonine-4-phosphate dehydrogenase PdxA [Flavobacteriaceae bacterium]MDH3796399.1 4-hydroxythreonine-4-phosphate dehydrogenase PdxA [Flavobacteriaceae bacterium]
MNESSKIRLGISIGDLNGIGSEVVLKTFADSRMMEFCTPVIFASNKTISQLKNALKLNINFNGAKDLNKIIDGKINVVNVWQEQAEIKFGETTETAGKYALRSLKAAVEALKNKQIDVLVTAPISKSNIQSEDFKFPGHTDYLAEAFKSESLMFMVTEDFKIGLMTDHVAVKDIAEVITAELVKEKIKKLIVSLQEDFAVRKPKIAVLGINPHSGDNGVIGKEDDEIVKPVIQECLNEGLLVFGPYAADSFFGAGNHQKFDAVLAAYHDQGLIPFKTLSFGKGVNFTAGLPIVRTSPDHGTAFEIAGKGQADAGSFKEAVFMAIRIFKNREEYKKLTATPLEAQPPRK